MEEEERYNLEEFLEEMKDRRARHTELITVYVPGGFDINIITKQLESEKSTATNIKSTTTRKNVQEALENLIRIAKQMKQTPENGVALFAGNVFKDGQEEFISEVFEPPEKLNIRLYRCDQTFVVDPLEEMLEIKEVYGLIVLDRKEATLGLLIGKKIKTLQKFNSMVPGKTTKGGQSAARYGRIRENMAKEFFKKIAEEAKVQFYPLKEDLKGILVGGPGPAKEDFLKEGQLITALHEKIIGIKDIGYADEHGLELLVEGSGDLLAEQEITHEKKLMEKFFNMLGKDKDKTAYGDEEVEKALKYGAVEMLFLSKKLPKKYVKKYEKEAKDTGVNVELISIDTEEGQQFWNLGGIGGILRFKVQ
jgi:peptide chain release factor subunit 1